MPTLNWIGKDKVVTHHNDVPFRVLDRKYTFGDTPDSGNMIIHGDNLEALKALLPEYENKIKCIYIDPPYNTGNENWVYNDNVNDPHIRRWLGKVVGSEVDDLTRHDKWLCMMYPRLVLLQRLLAEDGAIFISIDDNEQANLKLICDEIFGKGNFVGVWYWYRSATPPNLSYKIKKNLEYVLAYEKDKSSIKYRGIQKTSKSDDPMTKPQNSFKVLTFAPNTICFKNTEDGIIKAGIYGTAKFPNKLLNDVEVKNGMNANVVSFENRFIWIQDTLDEQIANGTTINCSKQLVLSYKKESYDLEVPPNLIDESIGVSTTEEAGKLLDEIFGKEKVFDFPKPPSLIEYLVSFLCDKNSIILDSFAGSGTTAHAILNLNKKDNGNRKFILCEMCDYAENITAERVRRVITGYDYKGKIEEELICEKLTPKKLLQGETLIEHAKFAIEENQDNYDKISKPKIADNCLKVIGTKLFDERMEGTGGSFDFYELGETIFDTVTGNLNDNADTEAIRRYVWFSETNSTYIQPAKDAHPYLLGAFQHNNYYFYYKKGEETCLDWDFLNTFTQKDKAEMYIIYADRCVLTEEEMMRLNIRFKKIPRDIKRV